MLPIGTPKELKKRTQEINHFLFMKHMNVTVQLLWFFKQKFVIRKFLCRLFYLRIGTYQNLKQYI